MTISDDTDAVDFARLDRALREVKAGLRTCWTAELLPTSPAARCREAARTDDSAAEFELLLQVTAGSMAASIDHAVAVHGLLNRSGNAIPLFAVGRALIECAARACYLLEPEVEWTERLRRAINEALNGTHEMRRFITEAQQDMRRAVGLPELPDEHDSAPELLDLEARWRSWARRRDLVVHSGRAAPAIRDAQGRGRPGSMEIIDRALLASRPDAFAGLGHGNFRIASAVSHGSWHALAVLGHDPAEGTATVFDLGRNEEAKTIVTDAFTVLACAIESALGFFGSQSEGTLRATHLLRTSFADAWK